MSRTNHTRAAVTTRIALGAAAGLVGGLVFGALMQLFSTGRPGESMITFAAVMVHGSRPALGWLVYAVYGLAIGVVFGGLAQGDGVEGDWLRGVFWGAVYGVGWWIVAELVLVPQLREARGGRPCGASSCRCWRDTSATGWCSASPGATWRVRGGGGGGPARLRRPGRCLGYTDAARRRPCAARRTCPRPTTATSLPPGASCLRRGAVASLAVLLARLQSSPRGLSRAEAEQRLAAGGPNEPAPPRRGVAVKESPRCTPRRSASPWPARSTWPGTPPTSS